MFQINNKKQQFGLFQEARWAYISLQFGNTQQFLCCDYTDTEILTGYNSNGRKKDTY